MKKRLFENIGGNAFRLASPQPMGMMEASEEKVRNDLISQISDDYKVLYGSRPHFDPEKMSGATIDDLKKWADNLQNDIKCQMDREEKDEREHLAAVQKATTPTKWNVGDITGLKEEPKKEPAICQKCYKPLYSDGQIECHHCGAIQREILPNPNDRGKTHIPVPPPIKGNVR